jgi:hypothetical protein
MQVNLIQSMQKQEPSATLDLTLETSFAATALVGTAGYMSVRQTDK